MPKSVGRATSSAPGVPGVLTQSISLAPAETPPADLDTPLSFWEQLTAVPENGWASGETGEKGYKVYLYDHEVPRSPYLDVVHHVFDVEWVKQQYGGGQYRAQLNDASGRIISKEIFAINGDSKRKPPQNVQQAAAAMAPVQSGHEAFFSSVVEMMRENSRETREMIREALQQRNGYPQGGAPPPAAAVNPMDILAPVLTGVVGMFQNMIPKPVSAVEEMLKLKQLMGEPKDIFSDLVRLKELGLMGGGATAGNGDLLKQLEVVFAVAEKMGVGAGGSKSLVESLIEKGPEMLGQVVKGIGEYNLLEQKRLETAKTVLAVQQNARAQQPALQPQQIRGPQATSPAATQAAAPAPQSNGTPTQLDVQPLTDLPPAQMAEMTEQQINQVKAEIVQAIHQGVTGQDLFGYLKLKLPIFLNGMCLTDAAGNVTGVVSEDELHMFCAADPVLSQAGNLPNYRQVLHELLEEVKLATMGDGNDEDVEER